MTIKSEMKKAGARLIAIPAIALSLSGCESQGIQTWVESTNELRLNAQKQGEVVPYRREQFEALKSYFGTIGEMALSLKNDEDLARRFNRAIAKSDLNDTCAKVFIARDEWEVMVERCTRNDFFLCAEEVRAYPEMVESLRGSLYEAQKIRFDATPSCMVASGQE